VGLPLLGIEKHYTTAVMTNNDDLKALVRTIADYPKPGILFRDITTLVRDSHGFPEAVRRMAALAAHTQATVVAGIEARGFVFGAALAQHLGLGFVLVRKKDKLPGQTIGINYALEYGSDRIEIHADAIAAEARVLLVDDLIATGGTAAAAIELIRSTGASITDAVFAIDLPELGGAEKLRALNVTPHALFAFEGH
jgi:adenine phosphoribosyltransferase